MIWKNWIKIWKRVCRGQLCYQFRKRSSVLGLQMPKFNACNVERAAVFCAEVYSAGFGFKCKGDNLFDRLEN